MGALSCWRCKYVLNSANINWYIYVLIWVIFNPNTYTIIVLAMGTTHLTIQALPSQTSDLRCNWSLLVSHATLRASASGGRHKQLGEDTTAVMRAASWFIDKCYQMVLCKRSRLVVIFPASCECYTRWLRVEMVLCSTPTRCDVAAVCFNYQLRAGGCRQSTFAAASFWSKI